MSVDTLFFKGKVPFDFCCCVIQNGLNNTRQGYARKRILKPAGFSFVGYAS